LSVVFAFLFGFSPSLVYRRLQEKEREYRSAISSSTSTT
jgi:uncharacterized membrane protein YeiB